jgi:hypothetical protein
MISVPVPTLHRLCRHLAVVLLLSGCGLLDTDDPDIIDPDNLDSPEGAEALRVGAIRDFTFAKDGDGSQIDTEGLVMLTGDMADEFNHSGFIPSSVEFDQRRLVVNNASLAALYFRLHVARAGAERAAAGLQQFALEPDNNAGIPEMYALAGFTYVFFAENFCSAIPFSTVEGDSLVFGPALTTEATLLRAIERFDAALVHPAVAVDPAIGYLASVGKGRALLSLGRFADAALAVADVPDDFIYVTEHDPSPLSLANAIFVYAVSGESGGTISVADVEGGNGLPYRTAEDPRIPYVDTGHLGLDQTTPQFDLLKYPDEGSSIVLADGIEARLVEAEAQLNATDLSGMNATLNALRAAASLAPLPSPGSQIEGEDQLFSERAFWMFATGQRLSDMRRLVRQYGRVVDEVYPVGDYLRGGTYGTTANFPIPEDEDNNPDFDRSGCNPNAA